MNVVGYKMFEVTARIGDMKIAALELNTGRSNVTTRIKALEDVVRAEKPGRDIDG